MKKILVTQSSMPTYDEYIEIIKPLWDTHWLTNMGTYHEELEKKLKSYLEVPELSLMVNGHMALELAIQSFQFPKESEIITTPFTFISTTHAIVRNGLKPVFCDIKESDGTIDESKIENLITEKTVGILPVHVYGHICNVDAIQEIANKYHLKVIYDAAHAFGIKYKEKGIGSYGDASIFSFHATKVFNSIEGGAVASSQREIYEKLYNLKNFGIRGEESVIDIGANAKMNEFCAAMGLCNLNKIDDVIMERKEKFDYYLKELKKIPGIKIFTINKEQTRNYAYLPIAIMENYPESRNCLYERLKANNIYSRKYFYPITADQECFGDQFKKESLFKARELSEKILTLPFYEKISYDDINKILCAIKNKNNYFL